ncbi:hypothetical protein PVAND_007494 [Polypedilum vanderplanki]|uniref:RNB domain-containing protein n=1 Tax=Polypedilum vanderplanki TaxID=319348 RepID=A0A9J6C7H4_POLVA|nr:hypothetical protein PVAND_007494 [Polypedilum vanderplanki]
MDEDGLHSKFDKLSINEFLIVPIAVNEYYFSLALNEVEAKIERVKSASKNIRLVQESPKKKKKKEDRMVEAIESCSGKLQNIKITVQNDQRKVKEKSISPMKKTKERSKEVNMFEQLKMLQAGKITANAIISSQNSPFRKAKKSETDATAEEKLETLVKSVENSPIAKVKREMSRNEKRAEIEALNRIIQEKIDRTIHRLDSIIDNKKENHNDLPKLKIYSTNIERNFVFSKTKIGETEIYRYSKEQMYYLQQFGTWEFVSRLLKLNICKTQFSPLDEFIMRLLESSNQERNELILKKAQEKNFISRKGFSDFTFLTPNFSSLQKSEQTTTAMVSSSNTIIKINESANIPDFVERFRLIAKSHNELNELVYNHEFGILFENAFKDQNVRKMAFDDVTKHLVETNQAYIVEGEIRVNQRNYQEAYVSLSNGMRDVCITNLILRKHAFHGDFVRVLVKNGNDTSSHSDQQESDIQSPDIIDNELIGEISFENRNFGCVLEIIEKRHSRRVLGSFTNFSNTKKNRKNLTFISRDTRIPNIIKVNSRTGIPEDVALTEKLLIAVEIFEWNYDQPYGRVVSIIGTKGQLKTENAAILQQNNLDPRPFDNNILNQLPSEPFVIPAREFEYREDLRSKCIFSIDPETARDLDDALSCEMLPNGNLEVGVHISDVSYFVKEDSDLDKIVREKATTIYLVDAVYHMLPEKLCLLCSLLPGADKMAYSVFFEMNPNTAEIYKTRYTRSIVNSCGKLSYDHAQMVIDKRDQNWSSIENEFPEIYNGFTVSDVAEVIVKLQKLAIVLRANRKANGALKIDQPKISFKFNKDDNRMETPVDFFKYPIKDSNRLIEEFMLLANISVATFINQNFPEVSLLRHHDPPSESAMKKLVKILSKHEVKLDVSSSAILSKSMENLIAFAKHPNGMNAAINLVVSKTMSRAKYFCSSFGGQESDFWHYALSIPIYTHFTSPIRRYADILVHRTLNAALGYEKLTTKTPDEIQQIATICNTQKYNAKIAGDDSSNLYFMHFIQSLKSKPMMAAVLGIYDFNLEVVLVETGHVIKIYYKNLQQTDNVIIKIFTDHSPPYVNFHLSDTQALMKIEFGMEILVQVEVLKDKLIINKIFYNT